MLLSCAAALVLLAVGCAPTRHTPEPYCCNADAAARLEVRAAETCSAMQHPDGLPDRPFVTDGCSSFLDGGWVECCVSHDIPYWCGGTAAQRREADAALRACVAETTSPLLGAVMELGVRAGGHPIWPTPWRWGYGRERGSGYVEPAETARER